MTTIIASDKFIKTYTNKNGSVFKAATNLACNSINNGQYGIIYDDFNPDMKKVNQWKKENKDMKIFHVSTRGKTLNMDSKIAFHKKMNTSKFTPESYLKKSNVTDKNGIYFVKTDGSTGSRGVNVFTYETLINAKTDNCVIQKSMINPDLYTNKRYKIRQHIIIHNKHVYLFKESFFTVSNIDYIDTNQDNLRNKHIICQSPDIKFVLSNTLEKYDVIEKNIILATEDFKKCYKDEIEKINENEFVILGFDFVVDTNKNVQIIEINHRSNYAHPKHVSDICDIGCIRDLIILMINKNTVNTNLILI
jgi:hypothetical protein